LNEPLDYLRLLDKLAILLLDLGVQVAALAEQHDNVKVAIGLERLLVRDNIRVLKRFEQLGFLLRRELVSLRRAPEINFFKNILFCLFVLTLLAKFVLNFLRNG
jgi:hypothetical protein